MKPSQRRADGSFVFVLLLCCTDPSVFSSDLVHIQPCFPITTHPLSSSLLSLPLYLLLLLLLVHTLGAGFLHHPCLSLCVQAWLTEIHEYAQQDVVVMLLGNKVRPGCQHAAGGETDGLVEEEERRDDGEGVQRVCRKGRRLTLSLSCFFFFFKCHTGAV